MSVTVNKRRRGAGQPSSVERTASVLIVDDQATNLATLEALLSGLDVTLVQALSGKEALRRLLETDFAAVVLDVQMPGLSGFDVAKLLRARPRSKTTPIIFLTAADLTAEALTEAYALGAVDFLSKPLIPEVLRAKVGFFVDYFQQVEHLREAERKVAETALRDQHELWHTTLASIGDAVIATDDAMKVTFLNGEAERLTGWSGEKAAGVDLDIMFRVVHEKTREPVPSPVRRALEQGEVVSLAKPAVLVALDGTERAIEDSAAPIRDSSGEVLGAVLVFRDITQRRQAEQRKDEFLAMLAHELRNPITPIKYALAALEAQSADESTARSHAVIRRQVNHLTRLIDDLLDVARITNGKFSLRREAVDLASIATVALETSRPLIDSKYHRLVVEIPEEPLGIDGDPVRLAQMLTNLLNNAAKYTDDGGTIWLRAHRADDQVVITVKDTGIGIAAEMLPRVFDPFTQVAELDRVAGGLGVGLTLVDRLVTLHGGSVNVTSDGLNKGSEFIVRLPLYPQEPKDVPPGPVS